MGMSQNKIPIFYTYESVLVVDQADANQELHSQVW